MVGKEHLKAAILARLCPNAHLVVMQGIAQLVALALEPQDPVPVDRAYLVFAGVLGRTEPLRERPLAGPVACERRSPIQCLVRALLVVDRAPAIECLLDLVQALKAPPLSTSISSVRWKRSSLPLVCG